MLNVYVDVAKRGYKVDSRLVYYLMTVTPAYDGAKWQMAVNIIKKYGIVPRSVYPGNHNTEYTDQLTNIMNTKVRETFGQMYDRTCK